MLVISILQLKPPQKTIPATNKTDNMVVEDQDMVRVIGLIHRKVSYPQNSLKDTWLRMVDLRLNSVIYTLLFQIIN